MSAPSILFLALAFAAAAASCSSAPAAPPAEPAAVPEDGPEAASEAFVPAAPPRVPFAAFEPDPALPPRPRPGVGETAARPAGRLGALSAADRERVASSFREAFARAEARGVPLKGALGGDLVHDWSSGGSGGFAQNWREDGAPASSWGVAEFALGARPYGRDRACLVHGAFLDAFGRARGIGGKPGPAGYGMPLTDEFPRAGRAAQRFEKGLMELGEDGAVVFREEAPPSSAAGPAAAVGEGAADPAAFRDAWAAAVDAGMEIAAADGPAFRAAGGEAPDLIVQTYGGGAWALVAADRTDHPRGPFLLAGAFLREYLAGGGWAEGEEAFGLPLTDPYLDGGRISQRFSKGTMREIVPAPEE